MALNKNSIVGLIDLLYELKNALYDEFWERRNEKEDKKYDTQELDKLIDEMIELILDWEFS